MAKYGDKDIAEADKLLLEGGLPAQTKQRLQEWVAARGLNARDPEAVCSHRVDLKAHRWTTTPARKAWLSQYEDAGSITRGDVIDVFKTDASPTRKLSTAFVWGWGKAGYGPSRLDKVLTSDVDRPLTKAEEFLEDRGTDPRPEPVVAYEYLLHRIPDLGPAFFTKYLYFADAAAGRNRALILDAVLAKAVARICATKLTDAGRADGTDLAGWLWRGTTNWDKSPAQRTAYRYSVYLQFMARSAADLGDWPIAMVERALFAPSDK